MYDFSNMYLGFYKSDQVMLYGIKGIRICIKKNFKKFHVCLVFEHG